MGATSAQTLARTVSETQTDANASGGAPSTTFVTAQTTTYNGDGSYAQTRSYASGVQRSISETIGLPSSNGTAETMPVPVTSTSGKTNAYTATASKARKA